MGNLTKEERRLYETHLLYTGNRCTQCNRSPGEVSQETGKPRRRLSFVYIDGDRSNLTGRNTLVLCEPCRKARERPAGQIQKNGRIVEAAWPVDGIENEKMTPSIDGQEPHGDGDFLTSGPGKSHRQGGEREKERRTDFDRVTHPDIQRELASAEVQLNERYHGVFITWLEDLLAETAEVSKKRVIQGGSWFSKATTQTTTRYLEPLISEDGPLTEARDASGRRVIRYKPGREGEALW